MIGQAIMVTSLINSILGTTLKVLEVKSVFSEQELSEFQTKLQSIRVASGFSTEPSFTKPLEKPPQPLWIEESDEDGGSEKMILEQAQNEISLRPETEELMIVKFTQLGLLVSERIDLSIRLERDFNILVGDDVPETAQAASKYDKNADRMKPDESNRIFDGYERVVGTSELNWYPDFPPIRTSREIKGKVEGRIFPGDSILVPIWVKTPSEVDEYDVEVVANPQNPQIPRSQNMLAATISEE